ncbi:MAG TPA: hypothetical protein H9870_06335 [Candidatus Corynebacterium avicola]|uniref:Uncharacterized protein n=1 Tax=Candidatus Corynebacterium avicola TaxID=2838527 RepID=A0A9D1ULS8_9CORY|nr:hypothetical protein [Candidatus Corynebacterium avicola]
MENESARRDNPSPAEAAESLRALTEDRRRLSDTVRLPWKLVCFAGLILAWYVGSSAADNHANGQVGVGNWFLLVALILMMSYLAERELGIRLRSLCAESWMVIAGWVVLFFVVQGIAFAGANEEVQWVVGVACVGVFGLTVAAIALVYRLEAQRIAER